MMMGRVKASQIEEDFFLGMIAENKKDQYSY